MRKSIPLILLLPVLILSCAGLDITTDYDPQANLNALKSYDWMPTPQDLSVNQLNIKRVQKALEESLQEKGLVRDTQNPDILVASHFSTHNKIKVTDFGQSYGGKDPNTWGPNDVDVRHYEEGALILDFYTPGDLSLLWRGKARGKVNEGKTPEERTDNIKRAVRAILEKFPPK